MAPHFYLTLFAFVLTCCVIDVRTRRIPNAISVTALVIGASMNWAFFGASGLLSSISGAAVMVGMLLLPFALGGLGGGDVKMMAAVGAFLGPQLAVWCLMAGMALGGVVIVIHLLRLGRFFEKLAALNNMLVAATITRSLAPLRLAADDPGAISLPYSIPLGLGTAAVVIAATWSNNL
jgi:prepilin peptidase CpaA